MASCHVTSVVQPYSMQKDRERFLGRDRQFKAVASFSKKFSKWSFSGLTKTK
jgi:hypothetical protein